MAAKPDPLALTGPYNVAIHTGRRSDRPRPLRLENRWCYVLCGIWHGNATLYSPDIHPSEQRDTHLQGPVALLLPPGEGCVLEAPPATGWESLHFDVVHVPRRRLSPGTPSLTHVEPQAQPGPEVVWGCRPPLVVPEPQRDAAFDALRSCGWLWWRGASGALRANARLAAWLADYVGGFMPKTETSYADVADPWLRRVRETALAGLDTGITAAGLAASLGIDRETLRRRLWRADRLTPGNLLRRLRIDRAKQELAKGGTVRAVARTCGYRSVTAFSNAFRRATGRPPGAWARMTSDRRP